MPNDVKPIVAAGFEPSMAEATPPEPQLPMLRFGLRQLFWLLTAVGLVVAGIAAAPVPGMAPLAVLLAVLVVMFHVVGTALGSRLREHADERIAWDAVRCVPGNDWSKTRQSVVGRRSTWHEHGRPLRWRWWLVAAGAVVGGIVGCIIFLTADRLAHAAVEVAFGAFSMAVVGAWIAFLVSHFWVIFRRGWREAVADNQDDSLHRTR
jgi:drug/metabolite transporter (DMT)-like permease